MEAGVSEVGRSQVAGDVPLYPDGDPRDIIELNYDIYKPSTTYSQLCKAIQKDMVLANLSPKTIQFIKMEFSLIETMGNLYRRNPAKYAGLNDKINDEVVLIANIVSLSRGEDGFTAKLMRKTIHEQKGTIGYEMGREKRREGAVDKGKSFMGF